MVLLQGRGGRRRIEWGIHKLRSLLLIGLLMNIISTTHQYLLLTHEWNFPGECRNLLHCLKVTALEMALQGQRYDHCMACNDTAARPKPLCSVARKLKSPNRSNNGANVLMLDLNICGGASAGASQDVCCFIRPPRPPSQILHMQESPWGPIFFRLHGCCARSRFIFSTKLLFSFVTL